MRVSGQLLVLLLLLSPPILSGYVFSMPQAESRGDDSTKADTDRIQARIRELSTALDSVTHERDSLKSRLASLQQEKAVSEMAGRDKGERLKALQTSEADLRKQLTNKTKDYDRVVRAIQSASSEAGIKSEANATPARLLELLSRACLQASAGNSAYRTRINQLQDELAHAQTQNRDISSRLEQISGERDACEQRFTALARQDKQLAQKMMDLQHEKQLLETKFLSRQLLAVQVTRRRTEDKQVATATLTIRQHPIGTLTLTAPREATPTRPVRCTLEIQLKSPADLAKFQDPEIDTILKHFKDFPKLMVSVDKRSGQFRLKEVQSPEKDNTNLWVWEATPDMNQDVDLAFRFSTRLENEAYPLFELPVSVPYPSVEKLLGQAFQPLPLLIGCALGIMITLPFFLFRRRRVRPSGPSGPESEQRPRSLQLGDKEL